MKNEKVYKTIIGALSMFCYTMFIGTIIMLACETDYIVGKITCWFFVVAISGITGWLITEKIEEARREG